MVDTNLCIAAYERHKNLKIAAAKVGIKWQQLYIVLKSNNIAVTGDKLRYGSQKDKFAHKAEVYFQDLVPSATHNACREYQSKFDFSIGDISVDIKAAKPTNNYGLSGGAKRYNFTVKKQSDDCDYFVLFGFSSETVKHSFILPAEIVRGYQTVSIPLSKKGKWWDFEVNPVDISDFFNTISQSEPI